MLDNIRINLPALTDEEFDFFLALLVYYFVLERKYGAHPLDLCAMPVQLSELIGHSIPLASYRSTDPLLFETVEKLLENLKARKILSSRHSKLLGGRYEQTLYRPSKYFDSFIQDCINKNPLCHDLLVKLNAYIEKHYMPPTISLFNLIDRKGFLDIPDFVKFTGDFKKVYFDIELLKHFFSVNDVAENYFTAQTAFETAWDVNEIKELTNPTDYARFFFIEFDYNFPNRPLKKHQAGCLFEYSFRSPEALHKNRVKSEIRQRVVEEYQLVAEAVQKKHRDFNHFQVNQRVLALANAENNTSLKALLLDKLDYLDASEVNAIPFVYLPEKRKVHGFAQAWTFYIKDGIIISDFLPTLIPVDKKTIEADFDLRNKVLYPCLFGWQNIIRTGKKSLI